MPNNNIYSMSKTLCLVSFVVCGYLWHMTAKQNGSSGRERNVNSCTLQISMCDSCFRVTPALYSRQLRDHLTSRCGERLLANGISRTTQLYKLYDVLKSYMMSRNQ